MALKFLGKDGVLAAQAIELTDGPIWVLGRDPAESDVILEDPSVSRRQARVERLADGRYMLQNLSRTQPSLIHGAPCGNPVELHPGDLVQLGGTTFLVEFTEEERPPQDMEEVEPPEAPEESVEEASDRPVQKETENHEEVLAPVATPLFQSDASSGELPSRDTVFEPGPALAYNTIFGVEQAWRYVLKVLGGPNQGAELGIEPGQRVVIGTSLDCDVVLNDLSVSRQHCALLASEEGLTLEDLGSRNGTLVDGHLIEGAVDYAPFSVITVGTSTLTVLDREHQGETIVREMPVVLPVEEESAEELEEEEPPPPHWSQIPLQRSTLVATGVGLLLLCLAIVSLFALFIAKPLEEPAIDYQGKIEKILHPYPAVQFAFNPATQTLLLQGHVLQSSELAELNFALQKLPFVQQTQNYVVADSNIWQETNFLIGRNPTWANITMFASTPGEFIIQGSVPNAQSLQQLRDFLNREFAYRDTVELRVAVQGDLAAQISDFIQRHHLQGIQVQADHGTVVLQGVLDETQGHLLTQLLPTIQGLPGVVSLVNETISGETTHTTTALTTQLTVSGWVHGPEENAVVINGRLLYVGDTIEGMQITSILTDEVHLEKDGAQFKILYNGSSGHERP